MSQTSIFWPMIAHVALVVGLYILLFMRRKGAVAQAKARVSQFRENRDEPAESLFVRNSLANQFELPLLFYAVCLSLFVTSGISAVTLAMAWLFVLSRYLHAAIHVSTNRIRHRAPAFAAGFIVLVLMWLALALHLIGAA